MSRGIFDAAKDDAGLCRRERRVIGLFLFSFATSRQPAESAEERLTRLMQNYGTQVLRVCFLYLPDHALAQDASQTAFVKAWQAMHTLRDTSTEKAWLMRIAVNTCKTMLRSREYRLYAQSPDLDDLPIAAPEEATTDDTVLKAVLALPEKYREVVTLFYYQGLTSPEIARVLRVPQATVLTRLSRARKILESELKGWYLSDE